MNFSTLYLNRLKYNPNNIRRTMKNTGPEKETFGWNN
jgi:hypothetical protein